MLYHTLLLDADAHSTAIATITLAVLTFATLLATIIYNQIVIRQSKKSSDEQFEQFSAQLAAQNEIAFKYNSVKLALAFDELFEDMAPTRAQAAQVIIDNNVLDRGPVQRGEMKDLPDDIYDLFDTIGYFVKTGYMKADVAHEYFHHWFSRYYTFYEQYKYKQSTTYEGAAWNNLHYLSRELSGIEDHQTGQYPCPLTNADLVRFFTQEKNLLND
jgi:hypothetical protein